MSDYAPGVSPDDVMTITFSIKQNGKPAKKEVKIRRDVFIEYNRKDKKTWADLYEMIVADKVYISITDLANVN